MPSSLIICFRVFKHFESSFTRFNESSSAFLKGSFVGCRFALTAPTSIASTMRTAGTNKSGKTSGTKASTVKDLQDKIDKMESQLSDARQSRQHMEHEVESLKRDVTSSRGGGSSAC